MAENKKKWSATDERGRRTAQTDSRVPDSYKANMPAYGYNNMTVGDIQDNKKQVDEERSNKNRPGYSKKWYE